MSQSQIGFILGRCIVDNMMLSSETIKGYGFARISPRCIIKVDMMKEYDLIDWYFLRRMLEDLAFPQMFVSWLMNCITIVSYSILGKWRTM